MTEKAIAESMGIGPEYIRRARQRAAKLRMLLEEQKKNYGIEDVYKRQSNNRFF